jgi:aminoglycoside 3-N-acetyltransferase
LSFKVTLVSLLKKYAPFVIDTGRSIKKLLKKRELEKRRKTGKIITREKLLADLKQMGIREGDSIMVHMSLSKAGYIEGGAETVVDVLLQSVGKNGNVLMPSFAHQTFSKYYLDEDPVFDVKNSPSRAGAVTEAFRKRPNVLRSFHPTDSVCAHGPLAEYFISGHFGQLTPYTRESPYYKLATKQGKILNIGVPLNTSCTNMHTLEDAVDFKFPIYHPKIYEARMKNTEGELVTMKTKVHDPVFSQKRRPDELVPLFEKEGVLKHFTFGDANVMLVDAEGLFHTMIKNYNERGVTMYTPHGS